MPFPLINQKLTLPRYCVARSSSSPTIRCSPRPINQIPGVFRALLLCTIFSTTNWRSIVFQFIRIGRTRHNPVRAVRAGRQSRNNQRPGSWRLYGSSCPIVAPQTPACADGRTTHRSCGRASYGVSAAAYPRLQAIDRQDARTVPLAVRVRWPGIYPTGVPLCNTFNSLTARGCKLLACAADVGGYEREIVPAECG